MGKYGYRIGKEREYRSWCSMKTRCTNPKHEAYNRYKNKGICDRWLGKDGFRNFYEDLGPRPDGCTLDRIDNNKGYSPDNCRWLSIKEQGNNRNDNIRIEYNGKNHTIAEWAEKAGLKYTTLHERLRSGMTIEQALHQKLQKKNYELTKKALANGLKPSLVRRRIQDGWSEKEALNTPKMKNQFG